MVKFIQEETPGAPPSKKAAIVQVSYAALASALGLPDGVTVTACQVAFTKDSLHVRVEGDALPVQYQIHEGRDLLIRDYVVGRVPTVEFKASM